MRSENPVGVPESADREPPHRPPQPAGNGRLLLVVVMLLALVLRLYQLGEESFWNDEVVSVHSAERLQGLARSRPLYFLLLRGWMLLGRSDAWLRGLAVVFGVLSVYALYRLGRRLAGEPTGLLAALLLAVSPLFLDLSQEVRFYTLSAFLGLVGTLALARALESPERRALVWWVAARYLMILTTPLNVLMLLPDLLLLWRVYRARRDVLLIGARLLAVAFLLWLPFAYLAARKAPSFVSGWVQIVPRPGPWAVLNRLMGFTAWWPTDYTEIDPRFPSTEVAWFYHAYVAVLLAVLVVALAGRARGPRAAWIAAWAFLPLGMVFVISRVSSSLWLDRYLSFAAPYVLLLLAVGFLRLWNTQRAVAWVVATCYLAGVSGAMVRYYSTQDRADWRAAALTIERQQRPDDVLRLYPSYCGDKLGYYYHGPLEIQPIDGLPDNQPMTLPILDSVFSRLPRPPSRLWLVYWRFGRAEQHALFQAVVLDHYVVLNQMAFKDLDVYLVTPPPTGAAESRHIAAHHLRR